MPRESSTWARDIVSFGLLAAAASYAVSTHGALDLIDWNVVLAFVGVAGVLQATTKCGLRAFGARDRLALCAALLFPLYVALQIVPLPGFLLRFLDPTRADLAQAVRNVAPASDFAPLSIAPPATWTYLSYTAGYVLIFLLMRTTSQRFRNSLWLPAVPLMAIGGLEAALGLAQRSGGEAVSGTYLSRDHFAGLLEMILPVALMYGVALLYRHRERGAFATGSVVKAAGLFTLATAMLAAIVLSRSKAGFLSTLGSFFAMGVVGVGLRLRGWKRWATVAAAAIIAVLGLVNLPSGAVVSQLGGLVTEQSSEGRWPIAKDTLHMIRGYPLFGVGLGAYYPGLLRYQTTELSSAVINAHNDYLQLLSELGGLGFLIPAILMCTVLAGAARTALSAADREARFLGLGCTGGLAAILIHSVADFNMYIPANAMVLAWITGIAASLPAARLLDQPTDWIVTPRVVRGGVFALASLATLYAGTELVFLERFSGDVRAERMFCRLGVCDSLHAFYALVDQHGGDVASVPQADLIEFLRRDPAGPDHWEDLGESLLKHGRVTEARYCFSRAVELGPRIPFTLIRPARFHFALEENNEGLKLTTRALEGNPEFAEMVFGVYEEHKLPLGDVLHFGLPADSQLWRSYLRREMGQERVSDTIAVWNALAHRGYADDRLANELVEFLIRHKEPEAAQKAWAHYAADRGKGYPETNRVFNGDFESDPSGLRFDWKIEPRSGAVIDIVREDPQSGPRSVRIQFQGTENLEAAGLSQEVLLKPGWYRFQARVRAKDLSTDQGVAFNLRDDAGRLNFTTEAVLGSMDWKLIQRDFPASAGIELVRVSVVRKPSLKFDNLIRGTLWIDQVSILPKTAGGP